MTRHHRMPLVEDISAARWLLLAVLLASAYFFKGFLVPVLAATIVAIATWPLRGYIMRKTGLSQTWVAAIMVFAIVILLILPITVAAYLAIVEGRAWFNWAVYVNHHGAGTPVWLAEFPRFGEWLDERYQAFIGKPGGIGEFIQAASGSTIGSFYRGVISFGAMTAHMALTGLFTLITLFVFYRDGETIVAQIDRAGARILRSRWERISRVVPATISATMTGMTLIAIGEGLSLGIAYWLAGVPSPIIFGVITAFMALIPGGAPLCFMLLSGYLVASGSTLGGILLFSWGTIELFVVDKAIRPKLVGGPVKMPFLPTFFGLVGGVKTLGMIGLFVGPVLMAVLVTMWREWQREIGETG